MVVKNDAPRNPFGAPGADATEQVVAHHLGDEKIYGHFAKQRSRTRAQRKEAERQAARNRVTIDMDPELEAVLKMLAEDGPRVSISSLIERLICQGLEDWSKGDFDPRAWSNPSRSMRFDMRLPDPVIPKCFLEKLRERQK